MQEVDLSNIFASYANFDWAYLWGSDFTNSDLTGASFSYSELSQATFTGSNLSSADLSGSLSWHTADWSGAFYDEGTVFADGMNPDSLGMILIPAPATLALLSLAGFTTRRRRL